MTGPAMAEMQTTQSVRVSGKVTDESDGQGIPGATIIVKGTTQGTVTDVNGDYSLDVPSAESVLVISFIGYASKEVPVGASSILDITLAVDMQSLSEVVVVGYTTQKKSTLTGSVAQVKGDDVIQSKGTSNGALALQGEVSGLTVTRSSSRPGNEGISLKVRGDYTVNGGGGEPLVVLDGLIVPNETLSTMNPNDIETISVLKDGAAAIYGTQAAGGVILVTTKKGKEGSVKVNYNGQYQLNFATGQMPVAGLQDWARLWLEAGDNDAVPFVDSKGNQQVATPNYRFFTRDELVSIIDGTMPMAPETYFWNNKEHYFADVNQWDLVYGTTASQRHNISLSGGNEKITYMTSAGFNDERSPIDFVYDGAKRFNFRTNLGYNISDMFRAEFSVSYDDQLIDAPTKGVGEGIQDMYLFPMYNEAGQYYDNFGGNNMLAKLDEGGRTKTKNEILRLGGKIIMDLDKHVKGLSFNYDINVADYNYHRRERATTVTMYDWDGNVTFLNPTLATSYVRDRFQTSFTQIHVLQGNYQHSFGDHNFGFLVGMTAQEDEVQRTYQARSNMLSDELDDITTGDITTQTTNDNNWRGSTAIGLVSYMARMTYDYKGIYLLDGLLRRDGSSRLDPDYRWSNFYNFGGGIRLSEMAFLQNGIFDNLKVYASYGETGSVVGIGAYDYLSNMATGSTIFGANPALATTAWISGITTNQRSWERVSNTNFGVDFGFLNNKLSGNVQYFIRENNDMLISVATPSVLGGNPPKTNNGSFKTTGWEAALNWKDQAGDLRYSVGFMFWDNKSIVVDMKGNSTVPVQGLNDSFASSPKLIEGKPLNSIYAYQTDGYFNSEEEVLAYYQQYGFEDADNHNVMKSSQLMPAYNTGDRLTVGSLKRVDVNKDGKINEQDLVYIGDSSPHLNLGINLTFDWKGFDIRTFFQGVGEQYIRRSGALAWPFANWWRNQNVTFLGNTYSETNTNADYPRLHYTGSRSTWNYAHANDVNIIKASYLRAKVLSLGYTLPAHLLEKARIDRLRFSVTANNLFVISNVKDGMDPEMTSSATQGNSVPYNSTLLFGIDLTF
ncbi:TonB-dependent receptor [Algoriphagus jejuensis]|uniref:TonB-dependent receptor n=2 Tax=Algoriphagus jejuensis TaxID=419934 RepID=A0ABP3Y7G4_9BACT